MFGLHEVELHRDKSDMTNNCQLLSMDVAPAFASANILLLFGLGTDVCGMADCEVEMYNSVGTK